MVVTEPGKRVKRIADIVRSAGNEEFFKDDQKITVAVSTFTFTSRNSSINSPTSLMFAHLRYHEGCRRTRYAVLLTSAFSATQEYWASHHNSRLRFPEIFGIKIRSGAIFPAEVCAITPGQRYKKRLSPEDTASFLKFSVSKPQDRLAQVEGAVTRNVRTVAVVCYHASNIVCY